MASFSEKKLRQIAIQTLLNGSSSASESFAISESDANQHLNILLESPIPLFTTLRDEIISYTYTKGLKASSDYWGLSPELLSKLSSSFPLPESTKHYTDTSLNITPNELKTLVSVSVQPQGPNDPAVSKRKKKVTEDKRKVTNYSIEQKINAVKEFVKGTNQSETARELNIPAVNLMRWRDKIRKEAFQDAHVENLYGSTKRGQRNKMFKELDSRVHKWVKENPGKGDQGIVDYAKNLARIDDSEPVIKDTWLNSFKKYFKLT